MLGLIADTDNGDRSTNGGSASLVSYGRWTTATEAGMVKRRRIGSLLDDDQKVRFARATILTISSAQIASFDLRLPSSTKK